jgi:hypothetical protein
VGYVLRASAEPVARLFCFSGMVDDRRKVHIERALRERDVRIACHIVDAAQHLLGLIDDLPPQAIEAMLSHLKDLQKSSPRVPPWRQKLRESLLDAGESAIREARAREDKLYHALIGNPAD